MYRGQYGPSPVSSTFVLSFFLTIFTPLSPALLLRDGAARNTELATTGGGDGSLDTRGNGGLILGAGTGAGAGAALAGAAAVDCGRVPGFTGSDGCTGAGSWVPVGGACASCCSFASICAILSSVLCTTIQKNTHTQKKKKKGGGGDQHEIRRAAEGERLTLSFVRTSSVSSERSLAN